MQKFDEDNNNNKKIAKHINMQYFHIACKQL